MTVEDSLMGREMSKHLAGSIVLVLFTCGLAMSQTRREPVQAGKILLHENWQVQSSASLKLTGAEISKRDFQTKGWYPATVPTTVVGTLVENRIYREPFFDLNLRQIPGCSYPIGANFSNQPMPADSPFRSSWWYRTEFHLPASYSGKNIWLHFDGINFRANIWLNGQQIANSNDIAGTFRIHELNIAASAKPGSVNTLAVEVFPQDINDLGWTFVDWNPMAPDKNMGLYREVYLTTSGPVTVRYPQVVSKFDLPSLDTAHLTVNVELHNESDKAIEGNLNARFEGVQLSQPVKLEPKESKTVTFTENDHKQLKLPHPRVWWPIHFGAQNLYTLETDFVSNGIVSDRQSTRFGIREITSEVDEQNHRVFKVNGQKILIRGGGWASDLFLRFVPERLRAEFRYVKDMNLNAIRLEGQLQPDYFFDLADQEGILIIAGWCCCSHWEHWIHRGDYQNGPTWEKKDYEIAAASQTDQIKRLRSHASLLVWLNGSDNPPPPDVEQMYIDILKKLNWPNPYLSSATAKTTTVTGVSGVKMEGPYEWVPPTYWQLDKKLGGAHGFATEISPGPAVPPVESLKRILPTEHLWPIDEHWNFHAGGGQFKTLKVFTNALEARYGSARDLRDYATKSQLMAYEGQRAMFEGFGANRYQASGVIQWMLNNAWPSMIWHLYDYYLMPAGGYFGTKTACEPVHVQYAYSDKSIVVVNTTNRAHTKLRLRVRVYDINSQEKFSKLITVDLPADKNITPLVLPEIPELSSTYFLDLTLADEHGETVSKNFYWLSKTDDVLDWAKSTWYYTPTSSFADMTQLSALPPVKLNVTATTVRKTNGEEIAHVTLSNPGKSLAFFVQLAIQQDQHKQSALPIIWQDNYVTLLPGESREIKATYELKNLKGENPILVAEGWNVPEMSVTVRRR
ncbi:MAG: glycosyl hydrolase family 2 [Blastocatellia bacterium]|nr:MAG: glycosyl hydrolase family 2 [Blastocatellia bacterium]